MTDLRPNMQIMHHGRAMELLYCTDRYNGMEIWKVKLLFVAAVTVSELFEPQDKISFLHTKGLAA